MDFQSILIIVSLGILINMSSADKTIDNIEDRLKLFDLNKYTYKVPSIEQRYELFRRRRRTSPINSQKNIFGTEVDPKENNNILPIDIGDIDNHNNKHKRHACKHLRNRWNQFRLAYDNDKSRKIEESKESNEESKEFNTEDPFYAVSAEDVSKNKEEDTTKKSNNSKDKQRKNDSERENPDKDIGSQNEEDNEAENKKQKDSEENIDKEEFVFTNIPPAVTVKENKSRKDMKERDNHRVERDVIEEENVATTAPGFKFTSGYGDFGSKVAFRNINV